MPLPSALGRDKARPTVGSPSSASDRTLETRAHSPWQKLSASLPLTSGDPGQLAQEPWGHSVGPVLVFITWEGADPGAPLPGVPGAQRGF